MGFYPNRSREVGQEPQDILELEAEAVIAVIVVDICCSLQVASVKLAPSSARNAPVLPRVQNVKMATSSVFGTSVIPPIARIIFLRNRDQG